MDNISYPPFSPNAAKSNILEVQIALVWYQSTVCPTISAADIALTS